MWVIDKVVFPWKKKKKQEQKDKNCWKHEHHSPIHTTLIIYQVQGQQYEIFMCEYHPDSYKSNTWKIRSQLSHKHQWLLATIL